MPPPRPHEQALGRVGERIFHRLKVTNGPLAATKQDTVEDCAWTQPVLEGSRGGTGTGYRGPCSEPPQLTQRVGT